MDKYFYKVRTMDDLEACLEECLPEHDQFDCKVEIIDYKKNITSVLCSDEIKSFILEGADDKGCLQ